MPLKYLYQGQVAYSFRIGIWTPARQTIDDMRVFQHFRIFQRNFFNDCMTIIHSLPDLARRKQTPGLESSIWFMLASFRWGIVLPLLKGMIPGHYRNSHTQYGIDYICIWATGKIWQNAIQPHPVYSRKVSVLGVRCIGLHGLVRHAVTFACWFGFKPWGWGWLVVSLKKRCASLRIVGKRIFS